MKKPIMVLIIISAIVLSATIALAATEQKTLNVPSTINSANNWDVMTGEFGGSLSGDGVYSIASDFSTAAYPLPESSGGNFELDIPFTLNGDGTRALVGLSTLSDAQDTSGWTIIGNNPDGALGYSHGGLGNVDYFSAQTPTLGQKYTAKLISTDGGAHATLSVDGYPGSTTVALSGAPKYVVLYLNNNGITGNSGNVPDVNGVTYNYYVNPSATANPSNNPTTNPPSHPGITNSDLAGMRDFYSHQPVVHMSNQSVIYNPDGTIKQVVTGTTTNVTSSVVTPASNATKPVVTTVPANVTASPKPVNASAIAPTTAAPTKSQSPGFEIILAAMGMIAALALITRKKK